MFGPLITKAEAAIIVRDPVVSFGCMGCARTNELVNFLIRAKKIPMLDLDYPQPKKKQRISCIKYRNS